MELGPQSGIEFATMAAIPVPLSRRAVLVASAGLLMRAATSAEAQVMTHIVLLGDSVFDNSAYVGHAPDVRQQLAEMLPQNARATLLARDGATVGGTISQLEQLPRDATHLVISAGGNDALQASGVLTEPAASVAQALNKLAVIGRNFRENYAALLAAALRHRIPTAVCTIYEPRFPEADRRLVAATALTVLNDTITREAFSRGLS